MAASDAIPVPRKNTAYRFSFAIRKPSDSTLITTWTGMDSEVSLDGGAFADCTNEATEIGTSGCGYIDLTAAEMNADSVILKVTVTNTGAVPLVFVFLPESAGDYRADVVQLLGTAWVTPAVAGTPDVNVKLIDNVSRAAVRLARSAASIVVCIASGTPTTTSIPTSICTPAGSAADQFKGRIILFDDNTTTVALRGQATEITACSSSATPVFTVTALTTAPVAGDTFIIV